MLGGGLAEGVVQRRQFTRSERDDGQIVDVVQVAAQNVLAVHRHGEEGAGKGARGRGYGKREGMHAAGGHGHFKGGSVGRLDGVGGPHVIRDQGVLKPEDPVACTVKRPFVCSVESNVESDTVRDGGSNQLGLEIAPCERPTARGIHHTELNHVRWLL